MQAGYKSVSLFYTSSQSRLDKAPHLAALRITLPERTFAFCYLVSSSVSLSCPCSLKKVRAHLNRFLPIQELLILPFDSGISCFWDGQFFSRRQGQNIAADLTDIPHIHKKTLMDSDKSHPF